jgi:hypothetical protein
MGFRKVIVRQSAADSIAEISWFLESGGLVATAERFTDEAYDFIAKLGDTRKGYRLCREKQRNILGFKCINYKKKYTIVFIELNTEIIVCEFVPSKKIRW